VSAAGGEEGAVEPRTKEELREVLEREMREREVEVSFQLFFAFGRRGPFGSGRKVPRVRRE